MVSLSIVIPVYNGAKTIKELVDSAIRVCEENNYNFQVILINDGSSDDSWKEIQKLASRCKEVIGIDLAMNYGQHTANLCGFRKSSHEYIITMDDDLQNPPSEIPKLLNKALEGYDLVIGKFETKKHNSLRRAGSLVIQLLNRHIFRVDNDLTISNYRCIKKSVINSIITAKHYRPYIPGLLLENSFKRANVVVKHVSRQHGASNYTLVKIARLTSDLLFNHSTIPLRAGAAIGFTATTIFLLLSIFLIVQSFIYGTKTPGWTSIMVLTSLNSSLILLMLSIIGEYVIRILRFTREGTEYAIRDIV